MARLQDKVVVVTGASSGFGRGIAIACAAEGAKVVVSDVHEKPNAGGFETDGGLTTVEAIEKAGGRATYVNCDVTRSEQVANLVAETVGAFGRLDVIVNNAGVYRNGKRLHEFTADDLDFCYEVNVKGTFFGAQEAIKQFLAQGDGGRDRQPGLDGRAAGAPQPVGLQHLQGCPGQPHPLPGHRVRQGRDPRQRHLPTYAKTSLTRELFDDKDFDQVFTESIPLKRWGEVEDVANLAVFLAGDESSYIHGDLIKVDGGETLCRYSV